MATMLPTHRKQHISALNSDRETPHHPLSPHASPDGTSTKRAPAVDQHVDNDESVLRYSHPLSPHATSREDDQAQCINEHNSHVDSTANVTIAPHPLSPHTTSLEDGPGKGRSDSTASAMTDEIVSSPRLTPGSSSFSMNGSTRAANSNAASTATTHPNGNNSKRTILLINGPNLNLLGYREPQIYGSTTLADITANLTKLAASQSVTLHHFQSNHEGQVLDRIHACLLGMKPPMTQSSEEYDANNTNNANSRETLGVVDANNEYELVPKPDAIIINPGAFTHTSVALRDALLGISTPFIEVHISNVHAREEFRHKSFLSDKAEAVIAGLGVYGYEAALMYWVRKWSSSK